jgi:hypothetical protein
MWCLAHKCFEESLYLMRFSVPSLDGHLGQLGHVGYLGPLGTLAYFLYSIRYYLAFV